MQCLAELTQQLQQTKYDAVQVLAGF